MPDIRFLIHGKRRRQAAVQRLMAAGFEARPTNRRIGEYGHPLVVLTLDDERLAEAERIVLEVAPSAHRL